MILDRRARRAVLTAIFGALAAFLVLPAAHAQSKSQRIEALGIEFTIDVPSSQTGGSVGVVSFVVGPSSGPVAHRHTREDEVFIIKSGSYRFLMDGVCITAGAGEKVYLPRGHIHQFINVGSTPAEHTIVLIPGGLEELFSDMVAMELKIPDGLPRLNELSKSKYGLEYFPGHKFEPAECKPASGHARH